MYVVSLLYHPSCSGHKYNAKFMNNAINLIYFTLLCHSIDEDISLPGNLMIVLLVIFHYITQITYTAIIYRLIKQGTQ